MVKFAAFLLALVPAALAAPYISSELVPRATIWNVHPNGDTKKCMGVLGGKYVVNAAVDIYDCNGSATQKWSWDNGVVATTDPVTGTRLCLDIPSINNTGNGVKTLLKRCTDGGEDSSPTQSWTGPPSFKIIRLSVKTAPNFWSMCLDLPEGNKTNRNVLQIWHCAAGNPNQIWTFKQV